MAAESKAHVVLRDSAYTTTVIAVSLDLTEARRIANDLGQADPWSHRVISVPLRTRTET